MTGSTRTRSQRDITRCICTCCICAGPIALETSNTDERGESVHEECYVRKTISKFKTASVVHLSENWFSSVVVRCQRTLRVTDSY